MGNVGVHTSPPFENMGLVIRPNLHRNSEGGVYVCGRCIHCGQKLSGKLAKLLPPDVRFYG